MSINLNLNSKITLNNGIQMPIFGLGTYLIDNPDIIRYAIVEQNYSLLDTAELYSNEREVGQGCKLSKKERESYFITSKLFDTSVGRKGCIETVKESLKNLQVSYIDQYLLHAPQGGRVLECYNTLLELEKEGLIKSVGVSNFGVQHLETIKNSGRPIPTVNQIEIHPWCLNEEVVNYCKMNQIAIVAYGPLTRDNKLNDENLIKLSEKYRKTSAQILLRWSVQKGFIPIPKSSNPKRIEENANIFDFNLSSEDMEFLNSLGKNQKLCFDWDPTRNSMYHFGPEK